MRGLGVPEAAADEALFRLAVDVVHCVGALAACAGPGGGEVRLREGASLVSAWIGWKWYEDERGGGGAGYLVWCWVFAEADIAVDAKDDVLGG